MTNKNKVAICFSGQMRNLVKTYNNFIKPNLFDINEDCEVFVFAHAWFSKEDIGIQYQLSGNRGTASSPIQDDVVSQLYKLYNPTKTLLEKQIDFRSKFNNLSGPWTPENRLSKMYSIKQSNFLKKAFEKENNIIFDAVVMLRYDIDIRPIVVSEYDCDYYNTSTHASHAVDVTHAIMSSKIFDKFSLLYDNAKKIVEDTSFLPPDEEIARKMLDEYKIPIKTNQNLSGYIIIRS